MKYFEVGSFVSVMRRVTLWTDIETLVEGDYVYPEDILFVICSEETKFNFQKVFCPRLGTFGWIFGESLRLIHEAD